MSRYQFEPLAAICRQRWRPIDIQATQAGDVAKVADVLKIRRQTAQRWQREGLTHRSADHAAISLDLHPANIWPEWLEHAA